jgi:NMD protein affecting ribosome stability and mRNA decay
MEACKHITTSDYSYGVPGSTEKVEHKICSDCGGHKLRGTWIERKIRDLLLADADLMERSQRILARAEWEIRFAIKALDRVEKLDLDEDSHFEIQMARVGLARLLPQGAEGQGEG